jgi:methylphosphotriester-DNA--protein-cysteine methyltransferase
MLLHRETGDIALKRKIQEGELCLAGNIRLKIYGLLNCSSGKSMKKQNRVFFANGQEAACNGFRPCGHCMKAAYKKWKDELI